MVQAMQSIPKMKRLTLMLAAAVLAGCGSKQPPPPAMVEVLQVSIDAANNCELEGKPVECHEVAAAIQASYPTSKPRVDVCLDKRSRFEAATEVMQSIEAAGFKIGSFDCGRPGAG
jgi:biopolymer transport protein ExbD